MENLAKANSDVKEVNGETTMIEITTKFPGARRALFARYHIGGCSSCTYKDDETLSQVCERNEITAIEAAQHILNSHEEDQKMLIEPLKLKELIDEKRVEIRLIDTRTREEHEAVKIPGSYFMTQELQQEVFSQWDRTEGLLIVLYDHTGKSSIDSCAWFVGHEMKNTVALVGGIDRWSEKIDSSIPRYRLEM